MYDRQGKISGKHGDFYMEPMQEVSRRLIVGFIFYLLKYFFILDSCLGKVSLKKKKDMEFSIS